MTKKNEKANKKFKEALNNSLYATVYSTLTDVLKAEYKTTAADGKEVIDYEMTVRIIKTKARLALDFVSTLVKNENQDK